MPLFDLDLLNALVAIAETGSLSAAAPKLCRSQSAVSEQIRKLETMCGLKLLTRGKSGARLTPAGHRLIGHARELLALSRAAYRDMQGAQLAGDLRLAITDYFRPAALPAMLRRVRDQFPRLHLHVSILKSATIEEEAKAEDFDIGLSMTVLGNVGAKSRDAGQRVRLRREPLIWVADKSFTAPESGRLPLVVLPETCSLRRLILRTLDDRGVPYTIAHSASGVGGLHLALAAGLGVTCLNASALPEGVADCDGVLGLPAMPEVEFGFVPPRAGEHPIVAEARGMLAEQFG